MKCFACGGAGHFSKCCRRKLEKENNNTRQPTKPGLLDKQKSVFTLNWSDAGECVISDEVGNACVSDSNKEIDLCRINSTGQDNLSSTSWRKLYHVGKVEVRFKLDTGADVNCIPIDVVSKINVPIRNVNNAHVLDYSSNKIKIHGKVNLLCADPIKGSTHSAEFLVVDSNFEPLLGLKSCVDFGLIGRLSRVQFSTEAPKNKTEFFEKYSDVFNGLGKFPGKCSIVLKENSIPTLFYRKRIPLSLHNRIKTELRRMEEEGIISYVDYPTDWVSNMQVVEKSNGALRICLDPKPLNQCIKREHYLIPTQQDLFSRLSGKRVFTVLDLSSGFWQMELDRESSDLTTFMTPFGRYRWNRVPFGLNNAPEMFQRRMVQIFGDITGVEIYFDDMAVSGTDEAEHDYVLSQVMHRARANNVKFNIDKLQFRTNRVKFMGNMIGDGEVHPLEKDVKAITEMQRPKNVADVTRFLGLCKYLAKFIPNLSQRTVNLRKLTHSVAQWDWGEVHEKEINDILKTISGAPSLAVFDPGKPVTIQTDSSKDGLGCVLLQDHGPVAYASRTLTKSEQRWAQIEKELLAVVFACQRFHYFIYGREFVVQSDHKPLETLVKRNIDDVTPRLQRMFLILLKYPGLSLVYTPGKSLLVADCLSRAALPETGEVQEDLENVIHSLVKRACMSQDNFNLYIEKLNQDERYKRIVSYIETGWPPYHKLDDLSQLFYKYREELHFENGLLFKDHRLVIPTELQTTMCKWLHAPHLGTEKTLSRARTQFFWPGMTNDIKEVTSNCTVCEKFRRNNQKEPLVQDSSPEYPFHRVSTDIFEYGGRDWLVLIDAYSGFICCDRLEDKTMRNVCKLFDRFFNCYGYPTVIRSDNVPFNSRECERYANVNNVSFEFSSPRYPQSNGLAEKGVAIAKNILKRCYETGDVEQFQYRLLEYNTTPIASMRLSPSQLFFGRLVKTRLPIEETLLRRNTLNEGDVQRKILQKRVIQKGYYDRHAKPLPVLKPGEKVLFRKNAREWHYGLVIRDVNGRSYVIRDIFGNHFRRNRKFMTRTVNNEADPSDILLEDHALKYFTTQNSPMVVGPPDEMAHSHSRTLPDTQTKSDTNENHPAIVVDPPASQVNAPLTPRIIKSEPTDGLLGQRSELYDDIRSSQPSVTESEHSLLQPQAPYSRSTRSGRTIIPPDRYGQWTY